MGEDLVTTLSMENGVGGGHHGPCTLLSMDPSGHLAAPDDRAVGVMVQALIGGAGGVGARAHAVSPSGAPPPDINQPWQTDLCDMLGVGLGHQVYSAEAVLSCVAPKAGSRKAAKRGDSIWGAWFFFTFYFKPLLSDKCKDKVVRDTSGVSGFDKSDLRLDMFLVQHDMENMYMWVFKERPENALGKMQLRSYMNGHSRPGEPQFPFSVDRGFVRSHRMQRKHYRGLSNPQCIHGIEVVRSPNLAGLTEADLRRWAELTGREVNFMIPQEASDFGTWRTIPNSELELERPHPVMKSNGTQNPKKSGLNLSSPSNHSGEDGMDLSPVSSKRTQPCSHRRIAVLSAPRREAAAVPELGARSAMAGRLVLALPVLLFLLLVGHCRGGKIGICYGRNADDLPGPDKVAQLIQQQSIKYVRIYDTNIDVIKAFANTGVELMVGVPNSDLLAFAQYQSNVDTWLKNSILPYYPATMITYITVGAEVTESPVNVSGLVVPAMRNVHTALKKAGLHKKITISSTHSLGILSRSFPPSAGAFNSSYAHFLKPLLEFLVENQAPFMVDLYPYYAYQNSPSNVSLNYALFSPQSQDVIDPNTGLVYSNMFDAQVDSIFFALMALNFKTLKIMVTESGWPNKGAAKETGATPDNAQTYNTNLIRHVVNDSGTPAKPGEEIDVYIFSLFNENRKPGIESERNWGLFFPDQSSIYSLDWTGRGNVDVMTGANITSANGTWCIASANASETDLQNALNWACGPGNVDCSAIQPSQPCYQPDTLASHASYAFNSYYQQNGANVVACDFGGAGIRTTKDPSYDTCVYLAAGSKMSTMNSTSLPARSGSSPNPSAKCVTSLLFMLAVAVAAVML